MNKAEIIEVVRLTLESDWESKTRDYGVKIMDSTTMSWACVCNALQSTLPDDTGPCWSWERFEKRVGEQGAVCAGVYYASHIQRAYREMLADCSTHNPTRLYGTDAAKAAEELNELENQVEAKEINLQQARSDIDCLNRMLRETGYGQGQIDAYVSQCEEVDDLKKKLADLTAQIEAAEIMEGVSVKNMKEMRGGPANDPLVG